mmetsp:Transcript_20107/g.41424  ORF Transcript_20107/g.41424 Transcript_20107/m.41424 type:complete len:380 (-) Transcript_20107:2160-3299(-)
MTSACFFVLLFCSVLFCSHNTTQFSLIKSAIEITATIAQIKASVIEKVVRIHAVVVVPKVFEWDLHRIVQIVVVVQSQLQIIVVVVHIDRSGHVRIDALFLGNVVFVPVLGNDHVLQSTRLEFYGFDLFLLAVVVVVVVFVFVVIAKSIQSQVQQKVVQSRVDIIVVLLVVLFLVVHAIRADGVGDNLGVVRRSQLSKNTLSEFLWKLVRHIVVVVIVVHNQCVALLVLLHLSSSPRCSAASRPHLGLHFRCGPSALLLNKVFHGYWVRMRRSPSVVPLDLLKVGPRNGIRIVVTDWQIVKGHVLGRPPGTHRSRVFHHGLVRIGHFVDFVLGASVSGSGWRDQIKSTSSSSSTTTTIYQTSLHPLRPFVDLRMALQRA